MTPVLRESVRYLAIAIAAVLCGVLQGCGSPRRTSEGVSLGQPKGRVPSPPPPPYAEARPALCGHPSPLFPVVWVDETALVKVKGAQRDVDGIPRGERLPRFLGSAVPHADDRTAAYRSLTVNLCLDENGRVACAEVSVSSGDDSFDDRVLRALGLWEFRSYFKDGTAVPVCSSFFLSSGSSASSFEHRTRAGVPRLSGPCSMRASALDVQLVA